MQVRTDALTDARVRDRDNITLMASETLLSRISLISQNFLY